MLLAFLLSVVHYPAVIFGYHEEQEGVLLSRYAEALGVHTSMFSSLSTSVSFYADEARAAEILKSFEVEFGVPYKRGFPSAMTKPVAYPFSAACSKAHGTEALAAYDSDCLLMKAFRAALKSSPEFGHDELKECRFWLRPWITQSLKRTETISVLLTFLHEGKAQDVCKTYDPN